MGQVLRRTTINVGIHTNGCSLPKGAWMTWIPGFHWFVLGSVPLWRQCCSAFWEQAYISAGLRFFFFPVGNKCAGCVSRSALKLLWWPLLYWFGPSNFVILSLSHFFSLVGMLPRLNGFCHCHGGRGIRAWHAKSSETKIHNSVHSSQGRVHDWNQALRSD